MAYTNIDKSSLHFNTKLYTGNGTTNTAQTSVGFQPDWVWIKERSSTSSHILTDAVRGANVSLASNLTGAQATETQSLISFDSDGFTVGSGGGVNENLQTYAAWNWKANGQGSANSDGTITTTYTSANTTAGFSIVKYTGTGANATVGHGLGVAPKMIIFKNLNTATDWDVYHGSLANTERIHLNTTGAKNTATHAFNSTSPTTSVFYVGTADNTNKSSSPMIAYCFAEKTGYSNFGSYVANGSNNGAFCYTGFKPGFIMIKSSTTAMYWHIFDNKRLGYNAYNYRLNPNANEVETTTTDVIDILSNGFKIRTNQQQFGTSGATYIYMAFAEAPIVGSNNVPAVAK